jgi:hypothetical protein
MNLASAYPNSDISVGAMTGIAVVMSAVLAFWIIMVFVAAREPRRSREKPTAADSGTSVAALDDLAEDEHKGTVLKV